MRRSQWPMAHNDLMATPGASIDSLWSRVAALPLVIEGCEYDRLLTPF